MGSSVTYLKEAGESSLEIPPEVTESVGDILTDVREDGDTAIKELTAKFDDIDRDELEVSDEEIDAAREQVPADQREAINNTISNVRAFHGEQQTHIEGFERSSNRTSNSASASSRSSLRASTSRAGATRWSPRPP